MALRLDTPTLYADEVRRLASRNSRAAFSGTFELSAPLLAPHAERIGEMLAAEVAGGGYAFRPLEPRRAVVGGKERTLYRLDPLDAVVLGVFTRVFMATMEPQLGEHLSSYRKGRSQWTACRAFLRYLRRHAASIPDPRQRGVFVLRRDVRRYDETIPVGPSSSLWQTLAQLRGDRSLGCRGDLPAFIQRAFRPPILQADGSARPLEAGVATGLPTQTIACNAYLLPLDQELLEIPGGFYARFGDDILFAHPDRAAVELAQARLEAGMERLGLSFNPKKSEAYWVTVPGRAHPDSASFVPVSRLSYLGFDVGFAGAQLRADKRRELWLSLRRRLRQASRVQGPASQEERAEVLCGVIRTAFDRRSPLAERYAPWLRFEVMSRADLSQLDHHIALHVAECVSGVRGVRAFRVCPPSLLYRRHGLPSLVRDWDAARHAGRHTR